MTEPSSTRLPAQFVAGLQGAAGGWRDGHRTETEDYRRYWGIPTLLKAPLLRDVPRPTIGLMGVPFDGGNSRTPGAAFGPRGIRNISFRAGGWNEELQVNPYEAHALADCGDVLVSPFSVADAHHAIRMACADLLGQGIMPLSIGGDHSITWPLLQAIHEKHGKVGVIHFDAHCDVSDTAFGERYHYGSTFRRAVEEELIDPARMIQIGPRKHFHHGEVAFLKQHGIELISSAELKAMGASVRQALAARLQRLAGGPIYLSFDIDFVDHAYAPGIGSPEPFGPTSFEAVEALRAIQPVAGDIVGLDLVEVAPPHDVNSITSYLAVQLLFEMVSLIPPRRG